MNYAYTITTPANTLATAKQKTILKVPRGIIHKVEIQFPPGPAGLLHLHINRAVHQVWPRNAEANYIGDDQIIVIPETLYFVQEPLQFEAYTWNLDEQFEHTVLIRIDIEGLEEAPPITAELLAELAEAREE